MPTKPRHKVKTKIAILLVMLIIFLLGLYIGSYEKQEIQKIMKSNEKIEIPTEGYTKVNLAIDGPKLSMSAGCRMISFQVTEDQSFSIKRGLDGVVEQRPLTHDIMKDIFDTYDIKILSARIDRYVDSIYFAKIYMIQNDRILNLDARPSDAVALSVRTGTPFYVKTDILENSGINTCK
ncbi:MAG: bifunctional nuclease domain-containing protein [Candidatus Aenigmatarchaeota archaeon]